MSPQQIVDGLRADVQMLPKRDTPSLRAVRKSWSSKLKGSPEADVIAAAQALERGAGQGGKWIAYELIRFHPPAFAAVGEPEVEDFVGRVASWYATDAFGTILSGPLWAKGRLPDGLIEAWSRSENRWLRRSAISMCTGAKETSRAPRVSPGLSSARSPL